jgi:tetratricopeptide (TPR) repeat protein
LVKNAELGDTKAASELAHRAFNTLDYAEAVKWFSLTKSSEDQKYKLSSEVSLAQEKAEVDEKLNEDYIQTLQKAIVMTPSQLDQIRWTLDLFTKKKEMNTFDAKEKALATVTEIEKLAANKIKAEKAFRQSTYGEYGGFEQAELLWQQGKFYELLEMKDAKAATDKKSLLLLMKKKLSVKRPGEMLMAIGYMRDTGEIKKVEELYNKLITAYPTTYVYFEKYARFAKKNKENEKGLKLVEEALKFPEGNQPQLNLLKTQILKELNRNAEALTIIDQTLKIEGIEHKKFKGTVAKLTELKAELANTK